jgi:hypothetical protein
MHHPGPPRFTAVGETIELAPRDPDPEGTYHWAITGAPTDSDVAVDDDPVVFLTPDVAGTYTVSLTAPDGSHDLTVRVFPADVSVETGGEAGASGLSGASGMSGSAGAPGAPGQRGSASGSGTGDGDGGGGGGRPRVQLRGETDGGDVALTAVARTAPGADRDPSTLDVEFHVDDRDTLTGGLSTGDREARLPLADIETPVRVYAIAVGDQ